MKQFYEIFLLFCFVSGVFGGLPRPTPIFPNHTRGCLFVMGQCIEECPVGTHAYVSTCSSPTWSQRTCKSPTPYDMGPICDLSRCDCDEPTVLDEITNKCVKLQDCPKC